MLQAKTQEQIVREKPMNPFDYLPVQNDTEDDYDEDNDKVLQIVEALKTNRKKLYDKKC